jgi:hypothetical protein
MSALQQFSSRKCGIISRSIPQIPPIVPATLGRAAKSQIRIPSEYCPMVAFVREDIASMLLLEKPCRKTLAILDCENEVLRPRI